jgi:TonB family protein
MTLVIALLLAAAPTPDPAAATASAKVKSSMTIEADDAGDDATPLPQGDERKAIGDHVRENSAEIRECYASRLRDRPTLSGKVIARFDIGPNGHVIGAMADGIGDRELIRCIVTAVRKWEFDKPASGGKLRVAYPFKFEPQPSR